MQLESDFADNRVTNTTAELQFFHRDAAYVFIIS